jgi:ABC-type transport system substrate-binding protein
VPTLVRLLSLGATVANLRGDHERARLLLEEAERLQPGDAERAEIPRGGRLSVALPVHVKAAEPGEVLLAEEAEILANVFETLVRADEQGSPVPWLCERWEAEDEGRSFLLTIRTGVVFSDGRPLTAELVARSIARGISRSRGASPAAYAAIRGAAHALAGSSAEIDGLEVVDERRLRFQLVERLPIYPALLTDAKTGIAAEGADGIAVGTGPFRIAAAQSGRTRLERNAAFWGDAPARLDAIEFRTGLHAAQIASGFRAGDYDIARDLLPEDLEEVLRDRRLRPGLVETPLKNTYFVLFSSASAVASRRDVRKALSGVVRTQDVVRRTLGRFAQPAEGLLPPGILGHDPGRRRHPIPRESALESLDASGLPRPLRLAAAVHPVLQDRYASLTSALLSAWADLGVEVTIETPTMTTYLEKGERSDGIDILIGRWIADYDDPDNFTYGLFRTEGGRFRNFLSSLELDELIEEARVEPRPAVRERLYRRFEQLLLDECAVLPLFHEIDYRIASARVVGLKLRPSPPYVNYAELGKLQDSGTLRTTRGIVRVPIAGEVHSLDPSLAFTVAQFEVVSTVFETLTKETEGARIIPWLASSFRAEEGGRRFRFRLREDVRFQDDRRLTARDVRYSFERLLLDAENKNRGILSPITGAEALLSGERGDLEGFRILSSHEFTIDLEKPLSFFPALLAHTSAAIVPEGTDPLNDSWKNRWVGTGPFGLVKFEPGRRLELEANHGYWRLGVPKGEGLVFTFGVPPEEILAGYKSGRFSLAWDLFPADVEALRHDAELGGQYKETPLLSTYYLVFNARKGPLADEELRRELVRSVDVEGLVRRHLGRLAIPAHSLIPPGLLGHETAAARPRSDERARQSVDLTGILHSVYEGAYSSLAKDLFAQLRERGFSVRLEKDTRSDYQRALDSSGADFLAGRWVADYPDSDSFLYGLLHSEKGLFGAMAGTPEVDRLIAAGRAETDPEIRHEIYREAEEVIARRALLLPLFHEQAYRFARPEIDGFDVTFSSPIVAYEKLSVRR